MDKERSAICAHCKSYSARSDVLTEEVRYFCLFGLPIVEQTDFITGEVTKVHDGYMRPCHEKNPDGKCKDFELLPITICVDCQYDIPCAASSSRGFDTCSFNGIPIRKMNYVSGKEYNKYPSRSSHCYENNMDGHCKDFKKKEASNDER